jgi:beta-lactamase class A
MHSQRVQLRLLPLFALAALVSTGLAHEGRQGRGPSPVPASVKTMTDEIASIVTGLRGQMGVAAIDLRTGETIAIDADVRFPTASTIKTAVMIEAWQQAADGRLPMDTKIALRDSDKVGGSGILRGMGEGLSPTVADLVHLMIVLSDNTATNMLIERLGTARVNARLESYGLTNIKLFRPTFRDGRPDVLPDLEREFGLGMSTPREMAKLMALIAEGKAVNRQASDAMIATLRRQQDRAMIPRSLPGDVQVANKTGTDEEKRAGPDGIKRHVRADAAIVTGKEINYVIAIYARQIEDTRWTVDNDALVAGAKVSRLVFDRFAGRRSGSPR